MSRRSTQRKHSKAETPALRFLRFATHCRTRDLQQLAVLAELSGGICGLIHALQTERGASSIFLGSKGARFVDLAARVKDTARRDSRVRGLLEHVDERLDRISAGARFYTRVAMAFRALDSLPAIRAQISSLAVAPKDALEAFSGIIACLLAVAFEAADVAADPETSRALVALANFAQGKEYAGQERASAAAALSRGEFDPADRQHLRQLAAAQSRVFQVFLEFADPACLADFLDLTQGADTIELHRMRHAVTGAGSADTPDVAADAWYAVATRRIDRMKVIENQLTANLQTLCTRKLADDAPKPIELPVGDVRHDGSGVFGVRSMLDVVKAQSQRIDAISSQLESARAALAERKIVERAKGILTRSRRLSEQDAYTLIRETAMKQNRRIADVSEAIVSMADLLKS